MGPMSSQLTSIFLMGDMQYDMRILFQWTKSGKIRDRVEIAFSKQTVK